MAKPAGPCTAFALTRLVAADGLAEDANTSLAGFARNAFVIALVAVRIADRVMAETVRWRVRFKKGLLARLAINWSTKKMAADCGPVLPA